MNEMDRRAEYEYLEEVRALLKTRVAQLEKQVSGHESDIEESGYKMWDEITHVIRDFDDVAALTLYDADIARKAIRCIAEGADEPETEPEDEE